MTPNQEHAAQSHHETRIEDTLEIFGQWIKAEHEAVHVQKKFMASVCNRFQILYGVVRETVDGAIAVSDEARAQVLNTAATKDSPARPTKAEIVDMLRKEFNDLSPTRTSFHRDEIEAFLDSAANPTTEDRHDD